ncbi:sialoadhesin-like isoform X2 [Paramisgurnus dabryanus]|uniref:sialoadhesin-like isoform X2 n=1 Tax=Paramisgurnus dabryanus TaxID=90735 RepID=UPI003CCF7718
MNFRLSSLILLLHIQGFLTLNNFNVTCDELNICALRGDHVTVRCFYSNINITTGFWFSQKQRTNWRNKDEPEDLTLDSNYSGRVDQWIREDNSLLTIFDLKERDSGEYQLMIIMKDGVKHLSSVTVNLTVSVLQVKMNPESTDEVKLSCVSSCNLTSEDYYYWYTNGQYGQKGHDQSIFVPSSGNTDSYYCSVSGSERSSTVCLSNSSCWGVTYTSRRVCALVGSTVDIHSSYSHPTGYTVEKTSWRLPLTHLDLHEEPRFAGRVEFLGNTLRMKNVSMNDTGYYHLNLITNISDEVSSYPGAYLTVTGTQMRSSPDPVIDGEKVILSCSTKCTLDNKHTYIWYKNGQQVTDGLRLLNKLYLDSINREELLEYSCTIRGGDIYVTPRGWLCLTEATPLLNFHLEEVPKANPMTRQTREQGDCSHGQTGARATGVQTTVSRGEGETSGSGLDPAIRGALLLPSWRQNKISVTGKGIFRCLRTFLCSTGGPRPPCLHVSPSYVHSRSPFSPQVVAGTQKHC